MGVRLSDFSGFPLPLRRLVTHEVPVMAYVRRISDGDTLVCFLDRRFYDGSVKRLRLRGINAPELGTPTGDTAHNFVKRLLPAGTPIVVTTFKVTYDRYEADVRFIRDGKILDLGEYIVSKGHAVKA